MSELQIEKGRVVAFDYVLSDAEGAEMERSEAGAPMTYLHGYRNIMPGLEEALQGKMPGDALNVTLPPERAYGLRQENSVHRVPIKHLVTKAKRYSPGMVVKLNTREGARDVVVIKAGKFNVDVDTNHPLAGKTITFAITINQVREASPEEIRHGHSHGIDGTGGH